MAALLNYNLTSIVCCLFFCLHVITASAGSYWVEDSSSQDWLNHGGDLFNRRYASKEHKINPKSVPNLRLKWKFYAGIGVITATPAIFKGTIYFPSWNGNIYSVKSCDGSLVWEQSIQNLTGLKSPPGSVANVTFARATPTIAGDHHDLLVVGIYGPPVVIALNRTNGELVWMTQLDSHNTGVITMSGTYYKGSFYIGTSSSEESISLEQCCTFRGSFSKLDIKSGAILWQTYMLPDNHGNRGEYAGAAIWGSSPSIDPLRNSLYIATGNLYSVPQRISQCQERQNNQTVPTHHDDCVEPDNHSNSILALDLYSGEIKWYRQFGGYDVWFVACNVPKPGCPPGPSPDADFGEAPLMITVWVNGSKHDVVASVQKSGFAWALNRDNGSLLWSTEAGPSGLGGGGTWGAATDEQNVYTNIVNTYAKNFTLVPSNRITNSGGWVAMDARDGKIVWSIANPSNTTSISGPVSVANGVLFVGSPSAEGAIYAIDTKSGQFLWSYNAGVGFYGGVSISDGCIYVGQGLSLITAPAGYNSSAPIYLFAFCI